MAYNSRFPDTSSTETTPGKLRNGTSWIQIQDLDLCIAAGEIRTCHDLINEQSIVSLDDATGFQVSHSVS